MKKKHKRTSGLSSNYNLFYVPNQQI